MDHKTNDVPAYAYTIPIVLVLFGVLLCVSYRRYRHFQITPQRTAFTVPDDCTRSAS
jgi:hypothetical protein